MINKQRELCCPVCGNENNEKLYTLTFPENDKLNSLTTIYTIKFCNKCSFIYSCIGSTQKNIDIYYKNLSNYSDKNLSGGDKTEVSVKHYNDIVDFFQKKEMNLKICDVGCAKGGFLSHLRNKGYNKLYGIEPSLNCAAFLIKNGYNIYNGTIFDLAKMGQKFDIITMSHVLEHIYDLDCALENIRSSIEDSGIIYIEVPDANQYIDNYKIPFHNFNYEHINHFTVDSICTLFSKYDFECIKFDKYKLEGFPSIRFIFKKNLGYSYKNYGIENTKNSIRKYIFDSKNDNKFYDIVSKLKKSQEKIIPWGIGSSTLQLFSLGLEQCNIIYFADSSKIKQGKKFLGKIIYSPEEIKDIEATILVLPPFYSNKILSQIKNLSLKNKVICL